jgi:hypothetical protein
MREVVASAEQRLGREKAGATGPGEDSQRRSAGPVSATARSRPLLPGRGLVRHGERSLRRKSVALALLGKVEEDGDEVATG